MSDKQSRTLGDSMEETKERHKRYLRAINNPIRRNIIRSIEEGNDGVESIADYVGLDEAIVEWHLSILIDGFCVEKRNHDDPKYVLTQEGLVVEYLDK